MPEMPEKHFLLSMNRVMRSTYRVLALQNARWSGGLKRKSVDILRMTVQAREAHCNYQPRVRNRRRIAEENN
jgi:hypothetical protein